MLMKRCWIHVLTFFLISLNVDAQNVSTVIEQHANPFESVADLDLLHHEIENQRLVLMGEATHGTSEFYTWRAEISKYLISEKGYNFIAVEGDWPAFSKINAYVKQLPGAPSDLHEAMNLIDRWPLWMWRNEEVKELVSWLYSYNAGLNPEDKVGFYGVDLYAKQDAMRDVVNWTATFNEEKSERIKNTYACLARFTEIRDYLLRVNRTGDDCSEDVESVLAKVRSIGEGRSFIGTWEYFNAEQNAKLVINAERHYRANLEYGPASWNYRARHFELTAKRLLDFYGDDSKGIVWAHNTHIGDARATGMSRQGMQNIGQLSRERLGTDKVFAIGFGTYEGEVYAARRWEGSRENMQIPQALAGSWEQILNATGYDQLYMVFNNEELNSALNRTIPHRAIGVTYQPEQESEGNYVNTILPERYNAFIFINRTSILNALD